MEANSSGQEAYYYPDDQSYEHYDSSTFATNASSEVKHEPHEAAGSDPTAGNGASTEEPTEFSTDTSEIAGMTRQPRQQRPPHQPDAGTQTLIAELKNEASQLNPETNKHTVQLLNREIERLSEFGEPDFLEVDIPKVIRVVRKVVVPVHRDPSFNFVGKLLGPGGKTLQNLISSTRCRVYILGRGSSREKAKEQELLASGDPKYSHFKDPLFIRVEATGPPAMAYQKIAHVLHELQYYLQPVKDDIYVQQMTDMGKPIFPMGGMFPFPRAPGMRGPLMGAAPAPPMRGMGPPRGSPRGGPPTRGRAYLMQTPPVPPGQGQAAAATAAPTTYSYDYSGYEEYPSAPPSTPAQYGSSPATRPPAPPVAAGGGLQATPQSSGSYGYDYSAQAAAGTSGPRPRHPAPFPPPRGGGKMPPTVRGRGRGIILRPTPY